MRWGMRWGRLNRLVQIRIEMSEKDKPDMGPLPPARQGKPHEAGFESKEGEDKEKMEPDSTRSIKSRVRSGISLIFLCLLLVGPPLYMLFQEFIAGVIALVISVAALALILSGRLGTNGGNGGGGGGGCGGGGCGGGN
jgi:hypothetical protein